MRNKASLTLRGFAKTRLCKGFAQLLVFLMVVHGIPLQELSRSYHSNPNPTPFQRVCYLAADLLCTKRAQAVTTLEHTWPAGWSLVSLPTEPLEGPAEIFQEVGDPLYLNAYAEGQYLGSHDPAFPGIEPAQAYWLLLDEETSVSVEGNLVDPESEFRRPISAGWNPVSTPWPVPVPWSDDHVGFSDGASSVPLSEAVTLGWIQGTLFGYDNSTDSYPAIPPNDATPGQLLPWSGYIFLSNIDGELFFSPPPPDTTPPTVAIDPLPDSTGGIPTVSWLTDITGTASDDNLVQYTLEIAPFGSNEFTTIATGDTSVSGDLLGVLDPTLMVNGLYNLRLSTLDVGGNLVSVTRKVRIAGGAKIGVVTLKFTDMSVPVVGVPITIVRTYDSRVKRQGDFGIGWDLHVSQGSYRNEPRPGDGWQILPEGAIPCRSIEQTLPHLTSVELSDTESYLFQPLLSSPGVTLGGCTAEVGFQQVGGTFLGATLEILGDNEVIYQNGTDFVTDDDFRLFDPKKVRLTTADGRVFDLDKERGITRIQDRRGNSLTITRDGLIHSSGRSISFTRDNQGRIVDITDPLGNTRAYAYDMNGDLVGATDQEGNTTSFVYDTDHNLIEIIDARGIVSTRNEFDSDGRLTAMIDADGNRAEFIHDLNTRQEILRDRNGNLTVFDYDEDGNVVSQTDGLGNTTTFTYDLNRNVITRTDPLGHTTSSTFDAVGNKLTETDPLGNTRTLTFDVGNRILTKTDPLGNETIYTYDVEGNVSTKTDALGNTTEFSYDADGNLISMEDPLGNQVTLEYDTFGNTTKYTDPLGNETTYTHDSNGNATTKTLTRTDALGNPVVMTTTFLYDKMGRVMQIIDPDGNPSFTEYNEIGQASATIDLAGNRTTYQYDDRGHLIVTTFPDGTTENVTYDANGNKLSVTDRAGRTTQYEYDAVNRPVLTVHPDGGGLETVYDAAGRVAASIDQFGNATEFEHDAADRRTKTTTPEGDVTSFAYDANGNLTDVTNANGNGLRYEYDELNQRTRTVFPGGLSVDLGYDEINRITTETDQAGRVSTFDYDALGRFTRIVDTEGGETTVTYDELGNQIALTNANGQTHEWEYDNEGRITKHTLPLGMSESFTYDVNGNVLTKTDFNGQTTTFTYDDFGRLITKLFPDGGTEESTYTPAGLLKTVTGGRGTTTYDYDVMSRLIKVTNPDGTEIGYAYDSRGNRSSVTTPSGTTTYSFNIMNRMSTVTDPDGGVTRYDYDGVGNRTQITYPNGSTIDYSYDALNRVTRVENRRSDLSVISHYDYTYDSFGNRTQVADHTGRINQYTRDGVHRVLEEAVMDPILGNTTTSYTYDLVGNRLTRTDASGTTNYSYDANDRLLSEGSVTYTYDDNGNTLSRTDGTDVVTYGYDFEDRLISVQNAAGLAEFAYDEDGIRVQKVVNGAVTNYIVDKNRLYAQVLEERDAGNSLNVSYVYGEDLISQERGGARSHYHYDVLGSTRALTDVSENVTDSYAYDTFGRTVVANGTTLNNYLFTGEQFDPDVGSYYLRARYYDFERGRFLNTDPFEGSIYDPRSLHRYTYAYNNPVNYVDPTGEFSTVEVAVATAIAATVIVVLPQVSPSVQRAYSYLSNIFPDAGLVGINGVATVRVTTRLLTLQQFQGGGMGAKIVSYLGLRQLSPNLVLTVGFEAVLIVASAQLAFYAYGGSGGSLTGFSEVGNRTNTEKFTLNAYLGGTYNLWNADDYFGESVAGGFGKAGISFDPGRGPSRGPYTFTWTFWDKEYAKFKNPTKSRFDLGATYVTYGLLGKLDLDMVTVTIMGVGVLIFLLSQTKLGYGQGSVVGGLLLGLFWGTSKDAFNQVHGWSTAFRQGGERPQDFKSGLGALF